MNINSNNNNSSSHISPTRYAPHLSEFYSIVNNTSPRSNNRLPEPIATHGALKEEDQYNRRMAPASVRSAMSTISDLRTLVTKRDIKDTVDAMNSLFDSSQGYAKSLQEVSKCASLMAQSLETLARLKGCRDDTAERMLSASGLFYLQANHENIMSQCLQGALGDELLNEMDEFQIKSKTMENQFKKNFKDQSMKLKMQERHNIKQSKRKTRNILLYKESLMNLQTQLDQLETLRHDYYQSSYDLVETACDKVLENVATVSRARVEISENIARKGWSGGGLDDLLMDAEDPFGKEDDQEEGEMEGEYQRQQEEGTHERVDDVDPEATLGSKSSSGTTKDTIDENNVSNSDFLRGPPTPVRKMSPLNTVKSPLGHKSGSVRNSSIHDYDESIKMESPQMDISDTAESAFDNSFSLPLAGSAKSRINENDDKSILGDKENILKDMLAIDLNDASPCSSSIGPQDN
ncbi:hypothetical protein HG535_0F04960 [Zygotorulaspora mrakii]|uniref:IMD domain-containing protein n=1 Tax=Zygotorulaspora mrakii TaxID=42260 RepID=A0A7H9B6P0_ZYGMR|nr:uncharacterized protein HG535_0F04960 [Zygotorulaspora mrakii]QLG73984.1 hypothetical protein HG535_0F04960 [Zygotorulaspora mrakii]